MYKPWINAETNFNLGKVSGAKSIKLFNDSFQFYVSDWHSI